MMERVFLLITQYFGQLSHWDQTVNVHEWSTFDGTGNPFFDDIQEDQWYFVVVIKED